MGQTQSTASAGWEQLSEILSNFLRGLGESWYPSKQDSITVLQGSSTYFLKELGVLGKFLSQDELMRLNTEYRAKMRADGKANLTNLANSIATEVYTQAEGANFTHFFGARSLKGEDGEDLFTSLWASKAAEILETDQAVDQFVIMDIGTGEIKRYLIQRKTDGFSAMDLGKLDGYKFSTFLEEQLQRLGDAITDGSTFVKNIYELLVCGFQIAEDVEEETDTLSGDITQMDETDVFLPETVEHKASPYKPLFRFQGSQEHVSAPVYIFGTASLRKIQEASPNTFAELIKSLADDETTPSASLVVLSPEEEARAERDAFIRAFTRASNVPEEARECPISGFMAWGNGSLQGMTEGEYETKLPIGLKAIKAKILEILGQPKESVNDRKFEINYGGEQFDMVCCSTRMWLISEIERLERESGANVGLPEKMHRIGTLVEL